MLRRWSRTSTSSGHVQASIARQRGWKITVYITMKLCLLLASDTCSLSGCGRGRGSWSGDCESEIASIASVFVEVY